MGSKSRLRLLTRLLYMNIIDGLKGPYVIDWERYNERPLWGIDFVHYLIRCYGICEIEEFTKHLKNLSFVTEEQHDRFKTLYILDAMLDILQKQYSEDYQKVTKALSDATN